MVCDREILLTVTVVFPRARLDSSVAPTPPPNDNAISGPTRNLTASEETYGTEGQLRSYILKRSVCLQSTNESARFVFLKYETVSSRSPRRLPVVAAYW